MNSESYAVKGQTNPERSRTSRQMKISTTFVQYWWFFLGLTTLPSKDPKVTETKAQNEEFSVQRRRRYRMTSASVSRKDQEFRSPIIEEPAKRNRTMVNWTSIIELNNKNDALTFAQDNSWKFLKDQPSKNKDTSLITVLLCFMNYNRKAGI